MENKYYVYLHITNNNGIPFYVGKGKDDRAYKFGRNEQWLDTVMKNGYDIIFLEEGLSEKEAFEKEIYWIKRIGKKENGGTLINILDGGVYSPLSKSIIRYNEFNIIKYNHKKEIIKIYNDKTELETDGYKWNIINKILNTEYTYDLCYFCINII